MSRVIAAVVASDMPRQAADSHQRGAVTVACYAAGAGRGIGIRVTVADEYVQLSQREAEALENALAVARKVAKGFRV